MNHNLISTLRRESGEPWGVGSRARLSKVDRPSGALVFVHGFKGDAWKTWLDFPGVLAPFPKVAKYDLFFYGYDSRAAAATSAAEFGEFLGALGDAPATQVTNTSLASGMRLRKSFDYSHIVICAHSLGAIVSRLALLDAVEDDESPCTWLSKVRLVLFAPAHSGALAIELASLALSGVPLIGGAIQAFARAHYLSLRDLDPKGSTVRALRKRTERELKREKPVQCHRAWVAHAGMDRIVVHERFVQDRKVKLFKGANHSTICKPSTTYDQPLRFVLEVLP